MTSILKNFLRNRASCTSTETISKQPEELALNIYVGNYFFRPTLAPF